MEANKNKNPIIPTTEKQAASLSGCISKPIFPVTINPAIKKEIKEEVK
jgi:hypothetical protein